MDGFLITDPLGCRVATFGQQWRATAGMVGIGGQQMYQLLVQHALRPVLRALAKATGDAAGSDLHPSPALHQALEYFVLALDPGQPLRVGDDRYHAAHHQLEDRLLETRRCHVVRRLKQQITGTCQGRHAAFTDTGQQTDIQVHVGAFDQLQVYLVLCQFDAQRGNCREDAIAVVVIHSRVDMRGAGHCVDAISHGHARHLE